jgi:hypothetical protein
MEDTGGARSKGGQHQNKYILKARLLEGPEATQV